MRYKILLFVPLFLLLAACASPTVPYKPDPFWENPRIVFRDVTVPPGHHIVKKSKAKKKYSKVSGRPGVKNTSGQLISTLSVQDTYGESINDKFNGVTDAVAVPVSLPAATVMPSLPPNLATPVAKQTQALPPTVRPEDQQHMATIPPGTTYVPLTFPVPPPKSMMQQFHMQIAPTQSNSSDQPNN